jgi:hypothetical protein
MRRGQRETARSARARVLTLLGVLAIAAVVGWAALAANSPPPAPTISAGPASPTNQTSASFTYTDAQAVTKFQCSLDGGAFVDCGTTRPSTKAYSGLAAGSHTFQVRAFQQQGSLTSAATSYTWVVDLTAPPAPSITAKPSDPSYASSASFSFTDGEAGVSFLCKLDGGSFAACTSPSSYSNLALGSHTFSVQAKDAAGNVSPATLYTWTVVPPPPTITATPSNPTNQTSASFNFTDARSGVGFQCQLDGSEFAACTSPKSYAGPLAGGSHTFQVKAVSGSLQSSVTSYTWTIDLTPPTVVSINRPGANPTNASSVSWTVAFSEPVTGVDAADLQLVNGGLGGTPGVTGVTGSGASRTVTASTGSGDGTLALKLVDDDSIVDVVGNKLGGTGAGNGSFTGQSYTLDRTPPPAAVITDMPEDPTPAQFADPSTFTFTDPEAGVGFRCRIDGDSYTACASPKSYKNLGQGLHTFAVVAVDPADNQQSAPAASYSWTIVHPVLNFAISGDATAILAPGAWVPIAIRVDNPNNYPIHVVSLTVSATADSTPSGCPTNVGASNANLEFQQANVSMSNTLLIPANGFATLPSGPVSAPRVRFTNRPVNQDACKGKSFTLTYQGLATK